MLLVCPDGVVVAHTWKRQLAGIPLAPLITWISALEISEEELRACLRDGSVSCTILDKLVPGSLEGSGSSNELMSVERFMVALDELELLVFELSDLEQDPSSTKGTTSNADTSKKRDVGVLEQDNVKATGLTSISEDPLRKQVKLDRAAVGQASSLANVSRNYTDAHICKMMFT